MSRSGDLNPGLLRDSPKLYHWATDELILNRLKKVVNKLSAAFHTNRKIKMRISPKGPDNFFCTLPIWNRYYPSFNLAYNSNESSKVFCPYNSHSLCQTCSNFFSNIFLIFSLLFFLLCYFEYSTIGLRNTTKEFCSNYTSDWDIWHLSLKLWAVISPKGPDNFFCTLPIWNRYYPSFNLAYDSKESSKVFCPYNSHSLCAGHSYKIIIVILWWCSYNCCISLNPIFSSDFLWSGLISLWL